MVNSLWSKDRITVSLMAEYPSCRRHGHPCDVVINSTVPHSVLTVAAAVMVTCVTLSSTAPPLTSSAPFLPSSWCVVTLADPHFALAVPAAVMVTWCDVVVTPTVSPLRPRRPCRRHGLLVLRCRHLGWPTCRPRRPCWRHRHPV